MRRLLVLLTLGIIAFVVLTGSIIFLAETHPFVPGDTQYPWQQWAEQIHVRFIGDSTRRADRLLDLVQRRIEDLLAVEDEVHQLAAATAIYTALEQALRAIPHADPADQVRLSGRLQELLLNAQTALANLPLNLRQHPEIAALSQQITLLLAGDTATIAQITGNNGASAIGPVDGKRKI